MRKKAILKKLGSRRNMYKILRETNYIQPFVDSYGNEILINPVKHFLKQTPYKNTAMNKTLMEITKKFSNYVQSLEQKNDPVSN